MRKLLVFVAAFGLLASMAYGCDNAEESSRRTGKSAESARSADASPPAPESAPAETRTGAEAEGQSGPAQAEAPTAPEKDSQSASVRTEAGAAPEEESRSESARARSAEAIQWYGYEEGVQQGRDESKKVFLNFYADWCRYCKMMDQKTFTDDSVIAYLNEHFVPIRVNSDQRKRIASNYNVRGLPVSWFIAENGENIGNQPGYLPPDQLLMLLKYIHTDSYKQMNFTQFVKQSSS